MVLTSGQYFVFLPLVFLAYWLAASRRTWALTVILAANYFFLAKWSLVYLLLIPVCSTIDFFLGRAIHGSSDWQRRFWLLLSLIVNIGLIVSSKVAVPGAQPWMLTISLSFYAFQALSYTLDIYRKDAKPAASYLAYLASVSFFPTLLAGPITRVSNLVSQWNKQGAGLDSEVAGKALFLIAVGVTKKLLVADYLGNHLVSRVFDTPKLYSAVEAFLAVYGYAFQLYYDFSGYSDVAIGSAMLLGFKLPVNFKTPYLAENIADFWRRWHISLSDWLRDYVFFALPQRGQWKQLIYLNLVITMLVGGAWHGFSANFLIWGLLHGLALAATRFWEAKRGKSESGAKGWGPIVRRVVCFHFVCFTWIFFRADSLPAAQELLLRIASWGSPGSFGTTNLTIGWVVILVIAALGHFKTDHLLQRLERLFIAAPAPIQAAVLMILAVSIQEVVTSGVAPFIYSKF